MTNTKVNLHMFCQGIARVMLVSVMTLPLSDMQPNNVIVHCNQTGKSLDNEQKKIKNLPEHLRKKCLYALWSFQLYTSRS